MTLQKQTILAVAFALMGATAFALIHMRANQRLGQPGIKATPLADSKRLNVYLPPEVLNYHSVAIPTDTNVFNGLPPDTSFAERRYFNTNRQWLDCRVVMMGTDRTSIHKPELCLTGSGYRINGSDSQSDKIRVDRPHPYDLPVMKLMTYPFEAKNDRGESRMLRVIYVYWFVADHDLTESHWTRMRHMSAHLLKTGELERWAYVSCFAVCPPGSETETYERMKKFIAASVPEFQTAFGEPVAGPVSPRAALR